MPKCKNSSTGTYKGTEPSPKGLGYCARGEKLGKKKKGLDGNMWEVKKTKNGIERWVKITKTQKSVKKSAKNKSVKKSAKNKSVKKSTKNKSITKNFTAKNIIIYKNNKVFKTNNKLTISNNNLVYLMFNGDKNKTGGRLYFGLANLKGNKNETIKDLKLNKKKQTFEFRYKGQWEDESTGEFKMIKVNDTWKIVFENIREFNKMTNFVELFKIVKIIE